MESYISYSLQSDDVYDSEGDVVGQDESEGFSIDNCDGPAVIMAL